MNSEQLLTALKNKFTPVKIPLYGECLVVPIKQFEELWSTKLICRPSVYDGRQVMLISTSIPRKIKPQPKQWTSEEVLQFIRLWNENPRYNIIAQKMNRSAIALMGKATELKKAGIIDNAYVVLFNKKKGLPQKPLPTTIKITPQLWGNPIFYRQEYQWSDKEEALLISLWKRPQTVEETIKEFQRIYPKRTKKAVKAEIQRLQAAGTIEPRYQWKKKARI